MELDTLEKKLLYALLAILIIVVIGIIVLATTARKSKAGLGFGLFFLLGGLLGASFVGLLLYRARKTHEQRKRNANWDRFRREQGYLSK